MHSLIQRFPFEKIIQTLNKEALGKVFKDTGLAGITFKTVSLERFWEWSDGSGGERSQVKVIYLSPSLTNQRIESKANAKQLKLA